MTTHGWTIILERTRCRIAQGDQLAPWHEISLPVESSPIETAQMIGAALMELGYGEQLVLLTLDSQACLSASFEMDDAALSHHRDGLLYEFEEYLPLAAEQLTADFIVHERRVLGVAVELGTTRPLVEALEKQGILLQSIVPAGLLAQQLIANERSNAPSHLVIWNSGHHAELCFFSQGHAAAWVVVPLELEAVVQAAKWQSLVHGRKLAVAACDLPAEIYEQLAMLPELDVSPAESRDWAVAAVEMAGQILTGAEVPWIDLRRGQLAGQNPYLPIQTALRFAIGATILLLITFSASLLLRAAHYETLARECQSEQTQLFQKSFPGQALPVGIRSRLESEHAKLAGLTGEGGKVPERPSALLLLQDVLQRLPKDVRFRLWGLKIEGNIVSLDGEVRTHGDTERLATALRAVPLEVVPPRSEQLTNGSVALRLSGRKLANTAMAQRDLGAGGRK
jgi:hypothetical protein